MNRRLFLLSISSVLLVQGLTSWRHAAAQSTPPNPPDTRTHDILKFGSPLFADRGDDNLWHFSCKILAIGRPRQVPVPVTLELATDIGFRQAVYTHTKHVSEDTSFQFNHAYRNNYPNSELFARLRMAAYTGANPEDSTGTSPDFVYSASTAMSPWNGA